MRFGQAAAEWGQAGNDGTTAVARRNSVRDPSVSLPARGGGRPPSCGCRCWMGLESMPASCCTVQVRNPRQADSSHTLSTQIKPVNAADARRRCWRPRPAETLHLYAATYMPYTPVFAHITQLRSPPRNPARCEFLQDACTSVRTPHMLRSHRLGSSCSRRHRRRSPFGSVVR